MLQIWPIMTTCLCMSASLMCLTFKEPLLQIRLDHSGIPVALIGLIFSMDTITYTFTSICLNCIPEEQKNFKKMVLAGVSIFILCQLLSGPCPGIFPDEVWVICLGIIIGGVGGALVNNNCVPALT